MRDGGCVYDTEAVSVQKRIHERKAITMEMPNYDGVLEQWKVKLIIGRAKLLGFKPHEMPEVLQVTVWGVRNFDYEPDHPNGATERTILTTIIDNRLRSMKRANLRYQKCLERFAHQQTCRYDEIDFLAMDVAEVVATFTQREQAICRYLSEGQSKTQIARRLGCSWNTVHQIMEQFRQFFQEMGLGVGLEGDQE